MPGWLLYTPNGYSSLISRGDSYVNFVTRCLLRGSVRVIGEGGYQQVQYSGGSGSEAVVVGSFTDIQYVLLEYFVCEFGRKRTTSDLKRILLVSVFIRRHLSKTRLSNRLL